MFTVLGCMLKVIRAQSRSHFVCSRFTRRLYYYRRLLYVKYKKTSSFNSIFFAAARSSVAEIFPIQKKMKTQHLFLASRKRKNDGNRFLSVMASKNFYTL